MVPVSNGPSLSLCPTPAAHRQRPFPPPLRNRPRYRCGHLDPHTAPIPGLVKCHFGGKRDPTGNNVWLSSLFFDRLSHRTLRFIQNDPTHTLHRRHPGESHHHTRHRLLFHSTRFALYTVLRIFDAQRVRDDTGCLCLHPVKRKRFQTEPADQKTARHLYELFIRSLLGPCVDPGLHLARRLEHYPVHTLAIDTRVHDPGAPR